MEQWRAIPGYEDYYEVSSEGRVRSLDRIVEHPKQGQMRLKGMLLTQKKWKEGYLGVGLNRDGVKSTYLTHRLVLLAFVGPCPAGMEARHNNLIPGDNRLENLRWDWVHADS